MRYFEKEKPVNGRFAKFVSEEMNRHGIGLATSPQEVWVKYLVAWMLGVPGFIIVLWFLFNHGH
jgi:hypothetical protein